MHTPESSTREPYPDSTARTPSRLSSILKQLKSASPDARRELQVFWSLALVCLLAYLPPFIGLFVGAWPLSDDALAAMIPWREFTRNAFKEGVLPLWNPHLFCGMAFMSNGQSAVLYPP